MTTDLKNSEDMLNTSVDDGLNFFFLQGVDVLTTIISLEL